MPKMDGLELLSEIVKSWPETYILVVSGYDEFKYAQKALKYGAKDYLLKPLLTVIGINWEILEVKQKMRCLKYSIRKH